jgi:regulatory protein YycI of two-component signal transduction system YycFG
MGVIFPLSIPGKIVLVLITIVIGIIFFKLRALVKKKEELQKEDEEKNKKKDPLAPLADKKRPGA